ncbi:MAG: AsmA family protein [Saprospiraceae bacterium]|nr:AsmA family protein [Saprospiraceae bacterium]
MADNQFQGNTEKKKKNKGLRILKRFFLLIVILLVLCIGALFAIPYFFKDQLLEAVKGAANDNLTAEVDFSDASLSFFKEFPKLTLSLDDYSVRNQAPFEGVTLIEGKQVALSFDFWSVIKPELPLSIHSVSLESPIVQIVVLSDGTANYNITLPADSTAVTTDSTGSTGSIEILLDNYNITNGSLIYDDRSLDMYVQSTNLNHSGKGHFTSDVYDLDTETTMDALTFEYDGIRYFDQTKVDMVAGFLINLTDQQYTLKENKLRLNALNLEAAGFVSLPDAETIDMDLSFKAPGNDFKELLSLIPNAYIAGYESVTANGNFNLEGKLTGSLKGDAYPAMDLRLDITKGAFKYPDLPLGISDIQTNIRVDKPQGGLDATQIKIPDFQLRVGGELVSGHFNLAHPISDPDLDTRINGQLDLRNLLDAFPMEGVQSLAGILTADIEAKARLSQLSNGDYENVNVSGVLDLKDLKYAAAGTPAVNISAAGMDFSPQQIVLRKFNAQVGESDFELEGEIRNFLAYFSPNEAVTGRMYMRSNKLNLNELAGESSGSSVQVENNPTPPASEAPFDRFDFQLDGQVKQVLYDVYDLRDFAVKGRVSANRSDIENLSTRIGESDFRANGYITNTWDYLFSDGTLGGELNIYSTYLDLNPFMAESPAPAGEAANQTAETSYGVLLVPDNIDLALQANMKKILYTDIVLDNLVGTLRIADESVAIENCKTDVLGGSVNLAGTYDTQEPATPYFNIKYDIQRFNFQKAFNTFNTIQTLAPIAQYIEGNFNSSLIMEGYLKPDMSPDYSTLSADGFLETIDAFVKSFPPLQNLSNQLNMDFLNNLDIKDTRNWFSLENGKVIVKEFDLSKEGVDMKIGGTYSLTQEIDYNILAKVPREKLSSNPLGSAADSGLDFLRSQASQIGVSLEKSEFVNLGINLTGTMTKPKVNIKLLGTDGDKSLADSAKGEAKELLDSEKAKLEAEAQARLDAEKAKLAEQANSMKEEATQKVTKEIDAAAEAAKKELEKKAGEQVGKAADKVGETLGNEAKESVEDIQKQLEDFNPFKKKKKKGN